MVTTNNEKEIDQDQRAPQRTDSAASKRVLREEIKDRHTSHWDMDLLSREELEKLMS